jgi:hypothetical protein
MMKTGGANVAQSSEPNGELLQVIRHALEGVVIMLAVWFLFALAIGFSEWSNSGDDKGWLTAAAIFPALCSCGPWAGAAAKALASGGGAITVLMVLAVWSLPALIRVARPEYRARFFVLVVMAWYCLGAVAVYWTMAGGAGLQGFGRPVSDWNH